MTLAKDYGCWWQRRAQATRECMCCGAGVRVVHVGSEGRQQERMTGGSDDSAEVQEQEGGGGVQPGYTLNQQLAMEHRDNLCHVR